MTTLEETLLQKLAKWRTHSQQAPEQTLDLTHTEGDWSLSLKADCVDVVGVRLEELTLTPSAPRTGAAPLTERARNLAAQVTGLLEPLCLVEVDGVAQLRSSTPACKGDERAYYEVLLHKEGNTSVRRYKASRASSRREQVAFTLTHEALAKLVTDLIACA